MTLDDRIRAFIAVEASITANCQPCLQSTTCMALENGADEQKIAEAVAVGKMVMGVLDYARKWNPLETLHRLHKKTQQSRQL